MTVSATTIKNGWAKATATTWCYYINGKLARNVWEKNCLNQAYYFGGNGIMVRNALISVNGVHYYINASGIKVVNQWVVINKNYYFFNCSGVMATNQWVSVYFVGGNGAMLKNMDVLGYRLGSNGVRSLILAPVIAPITSSIFTGGKDFNSKYFRIPHMIITKHGTIVAGSDIRYNGGNDFGPVDQGIARSVDGGKTWINKQVILSNNHIMGDSRVMDSTMIYNVNTDKIFVFAVKLDDDIAWYTKTTKTNWDMVYTSSSDDGKTWTPEVSIKHVIDAFPDRMIFLGGVGAGIVMNDGTMILPIQSSNVGQTPYAMQSGMIYSKDNGITWQMSQKLIPEYSSESNIVEYAPGQLLINARSDGSGKRVLYTTSDMGTTWIASASDSGSNIIKQPIGCMGSMIKGPNGILYCQPVNPTGDRSDPTLLSSKDNGATWQVEGCIYDAYTDGYTCLNYYNNRLYVVLEISGSIVFKDITVLTK